jgi:hypothetical protein
MFMSFQASGKYLGSSPPGSSGPVAGGPAGALNWDSSTGSRRRPHYYTRESPMQHWLKLVPLADLPTLTKEARDEFSPRPWPDPR